MSASLPSQQKAFVLFEDSDGPGFKVVTRDVPCPQKGEVLIRVEAAALNPVDWKLQDSYRFLVENLPYVVGSDLAGEIVELGEGVGNFAVGDKVLTQATFNSSAETGPFQQFARAEAKTVAKIPPNVSVIDASTLPLALATAYVGLYNQPPLGFGFDKPLDPSSRGKYAGHPLVVIGGAGSVGQVVIQLARLSGFSPIITTASLKHADFLTSLGATHVIDRTLPPDTVQVKVQEALASKPLMSVYDAVGLPETRDLGFSLLSPGGRLNIILPEHGQQTEYSDGKTILKVIAGKHYPPNVELIRDMYAHLYGLLEDGSLKPNRVEVLPAGLYGIEKGFERMRNGEVSGQKLVILPQDTA